MNNFNPLQCMSIKSKNNHEQCNHPPKPGCDYCGIHLKRKIIIRVDQLSDKKPKKSIIPEELKKYENDINKIILIQKHFRGWNIKRRNKSNNKEDCGTLDNIYTIPIEYYFDYIDNDGFTYAFDLRTFDMISSNPYNQKTFPNDTKFKQKVENKMQFIKKTERKMKYDSPILTEEQKYDQFLIRVFQKFDMIGQYTDTSWFNDLSLEELKRFYKGAYDMFDYRAQLPIEIRKKITKSGMMFRGMINEIEFLRAKHKKFLQNEILREMEKIVDEGEDKEYKTLGVNLILSALVEVSHNAAIALPHLVQATFD